LLLLKALPGFGRLVHQLSAYSEADTRETKGARHAQGSVEALSRAVADVVCRYRHGLLHERVDTEDAEVVAQRAAHDGSHGAYPKLDVLVNESKAARFEGVHAQRASERKHRSDAHREAEPAKRSSQDERERGIAEASHRLVSMMCIGWRGVVGASS